MLLPPNFDWNSLDRRTRDVVIGDFVWTAIMTVGVWAFLHIPGAVLYAVTHRLPFSDKARWLMLETVLLAIAAVAARAIWRDEQHGTTWFLGRRGIIKCNGCGYDLRGAASRRCPECGVELG